MKRTKIRYWNKSNKRWNKKYSWWENKNQVSTRNFLYYFALIVNVLKVVVLGYAVLKSDLSGGAVVTVISLLGKAYEPIAIFNVEYVDYKLNKVTVNKYIELLDIKDDKELSELKLNSFYDNVT